MTLARRHYQATQARSAVSDGLDLNRLTVYQRLYKNLKADKAILKNIAGISDKIQAKTTMLPAYTDWLQGIIQAGGAAADDQITPTLLIWQIDTGALDAAMPLAKIAIQTGMASTDEYSRTMPEIIIEQMAEQIIAGYPISVANLQELIHWATAKNGQGIHIHNMPDPIRAKILKAAGTRAEEEGEDEHALALYQQALSYNERIGVKKQIAALQKQLDQH